MATRRENAETLRNRLGVTINTENSKPLAATLQGWVDRSEAEPDAVKREVLTFQLEEALDVELTDQTISTDRLAELLAQAQQDPQAARDALREDPAPTQQQTPDAQQPDQQQTPDAQQPDQQQTPDAQQPDQQQGQAPQPLAPAPAPPITPEPTSDAAEQGQPSDATDGNGDDAGDAADDDQEQDPDPPAPATLTVRLSDAVPKGAGTYSDRDQPPGQRLIGRTPVTVLDTPGIRAGLRVGTLVLHPGD
ncbi:hypothetical protein [Deinococcus soli (ex Cha et al. 2016)]|uniref:hypothetical protein n=1 Tax=Deinococcus soli (ex Cha et al. 2016) TaxID=1309411 RepID=UPI001665301C|nr:hypothetical protein [Deinococcus soli (ex Cha et al. 2016)]GGB69475.1 hypothetical protein GCM10008019_27060 [Deinococcus soli (ex Cha et al. 2016)]